MRKSLRQKSILAHFAIPQCEHKTTQGKYANCFPTNPLFPNKAKQCRCKTFFFSRFVHSSKNGMSNRFDCLNFIHSQGKFVQEVKLWYVVNHHYILYSISIVLYSLAKWCSHSSCSFGTCARDFSRHWKIEQIVFIVECFHVASSKPVVAILEILAVQLDWVCSNTTRLLLHKMVNYCSVFGCNNRLLSNIWKHFRPPKAIMN